MTDHIVEDQAVDDRGAPKSEGLRALYWRSEILQVMYWLRGEGFGDLIDPPLLEKFLAVPARRLVGYLDRMAGEGFVVADGDWYSLSALGHAEGAAEFATSFGDLTRPTHGECSDDCWCHVSADEAAACAQERGSAGAHDHDRNDGTHTRTGHEH